MLLTHDAESSKESKSTIPKRRIVAIQTQNVYDEGMNSMKQIFMVILGLVVLLLVGLAFRPKDDEPLSKDTDTGFTRFETEELMREIGYVQ